MQNFIPTQVAARAALQSFVENNQAGVRYERERNTDYGPAPDATRPSSVSRLSPYIRHRMLLETQVLQATLKKESAVTAEKFIQEVCWRTYWKGWLEHRPEVWQRYVHERDNGDTVNPGMNKAINQAKRGATGIKCFDYWVEELITTGYLHNHTRMWFASIWIFTLNLPWVQGADFFMQHLCDADAASNTLSWRWVAGLQTVGKHYLARADNIARYTNNRFNPRGQLDETASPKTESTNAPTTKGVVKNPAFNLNAKSASSIRNSGVSNNSWLLIHDEDLSPDDWLVQEKLAGIIVIDSTASRSAQEVSPVASAFTADALNDATARLQKKWQLPESNILRCASPTHLAKQLEGNQTIANAPIVHSWIPVGPTRDALAQSFVQLRSQGVSIQAVRSDWDELAWPHATKGFFQFRMRIPELLDQIGETKDQLF